MKRKITSAALAVLVACAVPSLAYESAGQPVQKGAAETDVYHTTMTIDANQLDMFVTNVGAFAYDKSNARGKADGLYFPNTYPLSDKTVVYDSGLWLGGIRGGDTLVTVSEYSQEYVPGVLGGDPDAPEHRVYKIYKNHLARAAEGYEIQDKQGPDPNAMIPLTDEDYIEWPEDQGAPFAWYHTEHDDDGIPTDSTWSPWVDALGADQMTFTVFNDSDPGVHSNDAGSTDPLNVEVRQTTFAFDRADALGNVIFMRYTILYSPENADTLHNAFASLWSDPDLGGAGDDYVGCDPDIGLGFCYNATNQDKAYGSSPPAVGYDFFKGPRNNYGVEWPPATGEFPEFLPMTSFNKYINGTDPHSYVDSYNYMQGLNIDGTPLENGTTFQMPGDPVTGTGELDFDPADRRYMLSAGPFFLAPGDTVEVYAAIIAARGGNRLSSITYLRFIDKLAQEVFDNGFVVRQPPEIPEFLTTASLPNEAALAWSDNSIQNSGDYPFQGYNLWQGETSAGPWERIATYDLIDDVETIYTWSFDIDTGELYPQPTQFGPNSGIQFQAEITEDVFTWSGNPQLVNNHPYYFALSAYSYSDNPADSLQNFLESSKAIYMAVPAGGPAGADWSSVTAEVVHVSGTGTGPIDVNIVDETAITGDTYEITFTDTTYTVDTLEVNELLYYTLSNLNTGDVLIEEGTNHTADPNVSYPYFEGMVIGVENHPDIVAGGWEWIPDDGEAGQWLYGVDWGGPMFGGGASLGPDFFGSTLELEDMKTVEIRLTPNEDDWTDAAVYRRDLGYAFDGIGTFPGSAWDVTVDPPRQLNACFVEHDDPADPAYTADAVWNPNDDALGGRQYLFIMDSDYNGAVDYDDDNSGPAADVLWALWPRLLYEEDTFDGALAAGPGTFLYIAAQPYTSVDVIHIVTTPLQIMRSTSTLSEILVVPNPYYGHSYYETKSDVKVVKFTRLPETATIKILNIAGDHVRTLYKSPGGNELSWDLKNEYGIYVASGVYVYYVEAPGYGDTFGKLAVMLEEERLKEY